MCEEVVKCYKDILNSKGKDKWIEAIKNLQKMTKYVKSFTDQIMWNH